jgi:hypothetical protein
VKRTTKPTGNPTFAGIVASKMKRLWEGVKLGIYTLRSLGESVQSHRSKYHTFYNRWADKPPMSHKEWYTFWGEFRALEGDLEKWYSNLSHELDELTRVSDEGMNIVLMHQKVYPDDFTEFAHMLDRFILLASEAKKVFPTLRVDTSEEE